MLLYSGPVSLFARKVEIALHEKGLTFDRVMVPFTQQAGYAPKHPVVLLHNPRGQVPVLIDDDIALFDSTLILEYLEDAYPTPPLYPNSPFGIAKLLELTQIIDLYLELAARRVIPNYFARKPPPENVANDVRTTLSKGAKAVAKLASFEQFLLGDTFTAADIAAAIHFPLVRTLSSGVLECDPLGEIPGLPAYLERMEQRPTLQRIRRDQAADRPLFFAHLKQQSG